MLILIVSIITLTIILERGWLLMHRISLLNIEEEKQLLDFIRKKKFEDAESYCRLQNHPAYKIVLGMLEARSGQLDIRHVAEEVSMKQISLLEKYLPTLGTISTIAPLLGLLGTVTGMIKAFRAYEAAATRSAQLIGGLDEALITTAMGLMVAIPALILYNYYTSRVNTYADESELLIDMVMQELNRKK
jgi:biopolymer transport protein ExbB